MDEEQKRLAEMEKWQKMKWPAMTSLIITMIPVGIYIFSLLTCYDGGCWQVRGLRMMFYYITLGIPLEIVSVILAIRGLKTDYSYLAIASLIIKIVFLVILFTT